MMDDRKMFAPLWRGNTMSPESKIVAILSGHEAATATGVADALAYAGLTVGAKAPLVKRVGEMLDDLQEAGRVERTPDGRYRAVRRRDARPGAP